jgi:hypothetical protein
MIKFLNQVLKFLAFGPYIFLIAFYSYIGRVILKINGFPKADRPDPRAMGFTLHDHLISISFTISSISIGVFFVLAGTFYLTNNLQLKRFYPLVFLGGCFLFMLTFVANPLMAWYGD